MLFMARSALCIGLVAVAASNAGGGTLTTAIERGGRDAAEAAGRACLRSTDCLRMGASLVEPAAWRLAVRAPGVVGAPKPARVPHVPAAARPLP